MLSTMFGCWRQKGTKRLDSGSRPNGGKNRVVRRYDGQRLSGRLAGRPDPNDPTKTIPPTTDEMVALISQVIRLSRHEAMLCGMDETTKAQIVSAVVGQAAISEAELDVRMARLTPEEQDLFMKLVAKLEGRWVEPVVIEESSVETTATTAQSNGAGS